jgi:hypothetical protein
MVQITLGALTLDAQRIAAILAGLSERQPIDGAALKSVVHGWLKRIRQGQFLGFTRLMGLLDQAVQTARLRVATDLLLFRKTLYTLEGVIADIGAQESRIDDVLLGEFLGHFAVEWPARWVASPDCRTFATRLSNADLARMMLGLPWTVTRFWTEALGIGH